MHKYDLRLVYNHSCPQSFHGLSDVKGISLGQYDSSILTFTGHLHLAGIMLKARGAKRKPHHLSPRSPESNGREKQINTQLQQAVLNCLLNLVLTVQYWPLPPPHLWNLLFFPLLSAMVFLNHNQNSSCYRMSL